MQIPNVTPAELTELLSGLKANGGTVLPHDATSGTFTAAKKIGWMTAKAHGNYILSDSGLLVVTCDHEHEVEPELQKALASLRGQQ